MPPPKSWATIFLDLVFPPRCLLCGAYPGWENPEHLCRDCRQGINYIRPPLCACCGKMMAAGEPGRSHRCQDCLVHPPPFSVARSCIRYDQTASLLLHRLKYHGDTAVLPGLRHIIEQAAIAGVCDPDIIVPVPLYRKRLKARGLNQAAHLARLFYPGRDSDIRFDLLHRIRDTPPQTVLSGAARRRNLRSAFAVKDLTLVKGKTVCVVDDVFTTGTTVSECSRALRLAGAEEVYVLTLAMVVSTV
ncbi:ComF family protein [Desulfoprunum benzoelyticum]|nr:ComF family protein [Desulfoprunum benzoelyticum]